MTLYRNVKLIRRAEFKNHNDLPTIEVMGL